MKYLIFDAGWIIGNRNEYKGNCVSSNTLSPRCYPQGYAGFNGLYFTSLVSLWTCQALSLFEVIG